MGRHRASTLESFFFLVALLRPWIALLLAAVSYFLLRWLAGGEAPAASAVEDVDSVIAMQRIHLAAQVGQYLVPALLLIGALISSVRRIGDGKRVAAFARRSLFSVDTSVRPDTRSSNADASSALGWRELEMLAGEIYRRQGYRVERTAERADGGVDFVLRRGGERFLVQCKHLPTRAVDAKVVRELNAAIAEANADGGALVTSGYFTRDAVEFATRAGVELVDGQRLASLSPRSSKGD